MSIPKLLEHYEKKVNGQDFIYRTEKLDTNFVVHSRALKDNNPIFVYHQVGGPAIEDHDHYTSCNEYWLDGEPYSEQEYNKISSWVFNAWY